MAGPRRWAGAGAKDEHFPGPNYVRLKKGYIGYPKSSYVVYGGLPSSVSVQPNIRHIGYLAYQISGLSDIRPIGYPAYRISGLTDIRPIGYPA